MDFYRERGIPEAIPSVTSTRARTCISDTGVTKAVWSAFTACGRTWVVESWRDILPNIWHSAFNNAPHDHRFFEVTEETKGSRLNQRYFVLENRHLVSFAVQPFVISRHDLTVGWSRRLRRLLGSFRQRWPHFLTARILTVGNPAGESRIDRKQTWVPRALYDALMQFSRDASINLILLGNFPAEDRSMLTTFTSRGFVRLPALPSTRLAIGLRTFDDLVAQQLSKMHRRNLWRAWRAISLKAPVTMEMPEEIGGVVDEIFRLHERLCAHAKLSFNALSREYLLALAERLTEKVRCFVWRQGGEMVAFKFCLVHGDVLYDLDTAFDHENALDSQLYFLVLRDLHEWCARRGIRTYQNGPFNYNPKLQLGFELVPQDRYVRGNWWLRLVAGRTLNPVPSIPVLKNFSNYEALFI